MQQIDEWRELAALTPPIEEHDTDVVDLLTRA